MSALSHTLNPALQRLGEVSVRLSVELGRTDMALKDVLALAEGSVVSLDKLTDELLDITANGQVIAHGEVIAQDGKFALRIVSLAGVDEPMRTPPRTRPSNGPQPDAPHSGPTAPEVPAPNAPRSDSSEPDVSTSANGTERAEYNAAQASASTPEVDPPLDELTDGPDASDAQAPEVDDSV